MISSMVLAESHKAAASVSMPTGPPLNRFFMAHIYFLSSESKPMRSTFSLSNDDVVNL